MRMLAIVMAMGAGLLGSLACVWFATIDGWFQEPLAPPGDVEAFAAAAIARIDAEAAGNAVLLILQDGDVVARHATSISTAVGEDTLFQVASLSKWITAYGVMTLVEAGRLDLDTPVSRYLTRWQLPASGFDNDRVTVRRLLSHRAGLADGLGYAGFAPGEPVQSLESSLDQAADASPDADGRTRVGMQPGTEWNYSGGGFTLLQLIIEEVSGESFSDYMRTAVFVPLGMSRSTFEVPAQDSDLAVFHDVDGSEAIHYRFTARAAAGLYTSAADLHRFFAAQLAPPAGGLSPTVLSPAALSSTAHSSTALSSTALSSTTLALMRRPHAELYGEAIWGLGTMLFAPNGQGDFVIGHDGNNDPAINTATRLDPDTGDGIIVLETGNPLLATSIAGDWVFWRYGTLDALQVLLAMPRILSMIGVCWLLVLAAGGAALWMNRKRVT